MKTSKLTPVSRALLKAPPPGVHLPSYEREALREGILHLGVGNFHRAHEALYLDRLLESNPDASSWALCGVGIRPQDAPIAERMQQQHCLYTLVERSEEGSSARLIGAITTYLFGHQNPEAVFQKMSDPAIKIVTFTVTEAGYYLHESTHALDEAHPEIQHDLSHPERPVTLFGYLAEGLARRRKKGLAPFTLLSCDNIEGNGTVTKKALLAFCHKRNPELARWIEEEGCFPNAMVDRITPATTEEMREYVRQEYHLEDPLVVVAEPYSQWVIEDHFSLGRPSLEEVGVLFTPNVAPYEKMKIRLLNATHSAMGYLGYLCGYLSIDAIAAAPEFLPYLRALMDKEVTPLLDPVPGIDLSLYKKTLLERFANTTLQDKTLRICMDGSAKIPKYILPSLVEQLERGGPISNLTLCVASWMRFLNGTDESGNPIPLVDPQKERLCQAAQGGKGSVGAFLEMTDIFGNLKSSKRFVKECTRWLTMLYEKGAKETLTWS